MFLNIFSGIFSENVAFHEKIVRWKNSQNLISHIKGYIYFRPQAPPVFKKALGPQKLFFAVFFRKYSFSLKKKLLNNNIFSTQFIINRVMLIFGARCLLSLKNGQMCPQNSFSMFLGKYDFFRKNCWTKKYSKSNLW